MRPRSQEWDDPSVPPLAIPAGSLIVGQTVKLSGGLAGNETTDFRVVTAAQPVATLAVLDLPWPPTANTYYRSVEIKGRGKVTLISKAGREYRVAVVQQCVVQRAPRGLTGLLAVTVECWMPDRRDRDLGNLEKGLFDALKTPKRAGEVMAGVVLDDVQFRDIRFVERGRAPPGRVRVTIRRFDPTAA